jgi:hypothetical protein
MKKILLSLSFFAATGVFAQKNARIFDSNQLISKDSKSENTSASITEKVISTLWLDNFSDPATWTIDNSGQTGPTFGWNINNTSQGWWSPNGISSTGTSGGNNAELVNGNPTLSPVTQALGVVYTMTTASPIDIAALGGDNQVSLQFKQFGARFNDLQEIQISTDGTNFITVGDNLDKEVLSAAGGAAYPNPDTKTINLATFLSTNPTSVWIRFRWTTNFPGSATNPNVWIAYGWYIDDVKIITNPDYDLSITSNYWGTAGLNYYQIPTTQIAPIDFSTSVFNGGLTTLTDAMLKAEVFAGANNVFTGMSLGTIVPSLDTATLAATTYFTPPANTANYTLKRKIILGYLPNGQVLTGSLTGGGSGYSTSTGVAVTGGSGSGATFDLTASANGVVSTGTVSAAGTGYVDATGVATSGGTGTGLTLDVTATAIGAATSLTVDLYNSGTVVSETNVGTIGGTGTGLTVNVIADVNGDVASITIANPGSGYAATDYVTVSGSGGPIDIIINSSTGEILSATIAAAGTNYTVGDVLTIVGGNSDATYTVGAVTGGTITSLVLNSPGIGYTAGDNLTIAGGTATYSVGTVTNNTEITDELPMNNTIADLNFAVTNFTYARDNNAFAGSTSNGTIGFEVGNLYDIWNDQTLNGLTIRLAGGANGTTAGTEIFVRIYEIDPNTGDFVFLEESAPTIVAANNTNTLWTIPFLSPVNLNANTTYLAVVGSFDGTLRVSNGGSTEPQTSFFLDLSDNTWYYTTSIPVVRMNFDPTVSLTENNVEAAYTLAPNPTNGSSTLTIDAKTSGEAIVTITDMSGKQASVANASLFVGENSINLSTENLTSGVYFVNIDFQGATKAMKLIKK